jgi:two-component system response regulator FixJ
VVTDLSMPDMTGLELQAALAQKGATLPLVFLTGNADVPTTVLAMREGAVDFLEKTASQEKLLASVGRALERDAAQHQDRTRLFELRQRFARLTPREHEVLAQVVNGMMNKQIAARLGIRERTVKLHRSSIVAKMGVHSAAQLATLARDAGLTAAPLRNAAGRETDVGPAPRRNA